jgi:CRP-like cAMP-binding protein
MCLSTDDGWSIGREMMQAFMHACGPTSRLYRCGFFAWSTGVITSLLTATDFSAARFKETMDELEEFMMARGLPEYLCVRLKSFYMLKFPTMRIYDEDSVLEGLPQGLAKEVRIELFKDIMLICPLFYGMDIVDDNGSYSDVAAAACWRIRTVYKTMGLELTRTGEVPDALYIVRYGALSVFHSGKEIGIAHRGDVVGEMALFGLTIDGLRSRTTICASMCELCRLSKEDLQALLLIEGFRKPLRRMIGLYLSDIEKVIKEAKGSDEARPARPWRACRRAARS